MKNNPHAKITQYLDSKKVQNVSATDWMSKLDDENL